MSNKNNDENAGIIAFIAALLLFGGLGLVISKDASKPDYPSSSSSYSYSSYSAPIETLNNDEIEYIKEKAPKNSYKITDNDITFNIPTEITVTKNKLKVKSPAGNSEYEIVKKIDDKYYVIRDTEDGLTGTAELVDGGWILDGNIKYK
jgi:hypothetical protein